jgi:4'-phosphopantetheinyl transferase
MIHVSYFAHPTEQLQSVLQRGRELLNATETDRYERYSQIESKHQLLISRWLVHERLARSFPEFTRAWQLANDSDGRPIARHASIGNPIALSISHCNGLALCAMSDECSIGVDTEPRNVDLKYSFMDFVFNELEQCLIQQSNQQMQEQMLLRWTIKESIAKMMGQVEMEQIIDIETQSIEFLEEGCFANIESSSSTLYRIPVSADHIAILAMSVPGTVPKIDNAALWATRA